MRRLAPWLGPLVVLVIELPSIWTAPHVGDWFLFWYAGHITAGGLSPYEPASWLPATTDYGAVAGGIAINTMNGVDIAALHEVRWLWPPFVGLLLLPFGALPLDVGIPLLHAGTVGLALASTVGLVVVMAPPRSRALPLALLLASAPLMEVMRAMSPTVLILPGVALLFASLARPDPVRLGLGAVGLSARSALFALSLPATLVAFIGRAGRRATLGAAGLWLVLNAVAFVLQPVPLDPALLESARAYSLNDNASTWRLAYVLAPTAILPIALVLLAIAGVLAAVAIRRADPGARAEIVVACGLAIAIAVAPYTRTYDHLALFPAWLLALVATSDAPVARRAAIGAAVIAVALGYGWSAYLVGAAGMQAPVALTPYFALALLALTSRTARALSRA